MPLTYVLSPMAEADLEEIWIYTAQEWSAQQAEIHTNDIINGFEDIAAGKKVGGLPPLKWSSAMFRKTEEYHGKQATKARRDCHEVTAG